MTVGQLKALIQNVDDSSIVVGFVPGMGGLAETTVAYRDRIGGLDNRYSFEEVDCLVLTDGNAAHMQSQGLDVLGTGDP